jgi:predicted HicB family RNase H-like nuclease
MTSMTYKNYVATVEYDEEAKLFHGEVANMSAMLTFQGRSVDDLETAFAGTVDDYIEWCKERGKEPEKPYSGKFALRLEPSLHARVASAAHRAGKSLNAFVSDTLAKVA